MAEGARDKSRHRDIGAIALRGFHRVARHRQFADVEFGGAEGAEENLLRHKLHEHWIDAVDLDVAVDQRTGAVIRANGNGKIEIGHCTSFGQAKSISRPDSALPRCSGQARASAWRIAKWVRRPRKQ